MNYPLTMGDHNFNIQGLNDEQVLKAGRKYGYNLFGDFPPEKRENIILKNI